MTLEETYAVIPATWTECSGVGEEGTANRETLTPRHRCVRILGCRHGSQNSAALQKKEEKTRSDMEEMVLERKWEIEHMMNQSTNVEDTKIRRDFITS